MMEDLEPEKARAIIDPALKLMMDAVHRYDGYVVQSTGDGIFALKGGTAINLFVRDMPRLSVDIDLTYLPLTDRPTALRDIDRALH